MCLLVSLVFVWVIVERVLGEWNSPMFSCVLPSFSSHSQDFIRDDIVSYFSGYRYSSTVVMKAFLWLKCKEIRAVFNFIFSIHCKCNCLTVAGKCFSDIALLVVLYCCWIGCCVVTELASFG